MPRLHNPRPVLRSYCPSVGWFGADTSPLNLYHFHRNALFFIVTRTDKSLFSPYTCPSPPDESRFGMRSDKFQRAKTRRKKKIHEKKWWKNWFIKLIACRMWIAAAPNKWYTTGDFVCAAHYVNETFNNDLNCFNMDFLLFFVFLIIIYYSRVPWCHSNNQRTNETKKQQRKKKT